MSASQRPTIRGGKKKRMLALVSATLLAASFGLIVRFAQRRQCNLYAVGALNYVVAAAFHAIRWSLAPTTTLEAGTWQLGIAGGVIYVVSYFLLFRAMRMKGVSICTAVSRLAILIPVLVAVIAWGERPSGIQAAGALLALASLPLLTLNPGEHQKLSKRGALLLLALFVGNGSGCLALRAFDQLGVQEQGPAFLTILFASAAAVGVAVWIARRQGSAARDLLPGVVLGVCNALSNLAMVTALAQLPSVIVFPFWSSVSLVFTALFARLVWHERINRLETVGMMASLFAVALINIA
jgi:drug/metabolite transporter (DMT)-like permease